MNKKLMSTILLFIVFAGFLWWGLSLLWFGVTTLNTPKGDGENIVYALLLLACAGYALISLLMLPRRKEP
ncbi:MAG: hypothetical protein NVS4B12_10820 [Ktedonobacteraceae bacterium]